MMEHEVILQDLYEQFQTGLSLVAMVPNKSLVTYCGKEVRSIMFGGADLTPTHRIELKDGTLRSAAWDTKLLMVEQS
jgi:hypothetical protein